MRTLALATTRSAFEHTRLGRVVKVLLVLLCLVLPFLAVLLKKGPCLQVLWAFLLQLLGHIPGVIYGIYQVVTD